MRGNLYRSTVSMAVIVTAGLFGDVTSAQETKTEIPGLAVSLGSLPTRATEALAIEWTDLHPERAFEDPFEKLSDDQLQDLAYATRIRALIAANKLSADGTDAKAATEIERRLTKSGVDVAYLLSLRDQVGRMRTLQANATQADLIGKEVSFVAFVVPLKRSKDSVTECFLVGNFDACTHSAPPPPNQVVFLAASDGFVLPSITSAVRVTGRLLAQRTTRFRPGSTNLAKMTAAYSMTEHEIELFDNKSVVKSSTK
jgi:hypothetical protein